jgi:hypothetical protein
LVHVLPQVHELKEENCLAGHSLYEPLHVPVQAVTEPTEGAEHTVDAGGKTTEMCA